MVHRLQLLGEALRVPGRDQEAVNAVADDIGVAGDCRGDHRRAGGEGLGQHHAEALAGERGRAEHVGVAVGLPELLLRDAPAGIDLAEDRRDRRGGARSRRGDADRGQAAGDVLGERLEGAQQHRQALALLGAADEQHLQLVAIVRRRLAGAKLEVDAVGNDLVLAAEPAAPGPGGGLGDGDPLVQLVELAPRAEQAGDVVGPRLGRVGVEGADDRGAAEGACVPAERRSGWLLQVDDVEVAGAQLTAHPGQRVGKDRDVGDRAVHRDPDGAAERDHVFGQRALARGGAAVERTAETIRRIPGCEYPNLVTSIKQMLGKRLRMPVYASLIRPRIGRDESNAHGDEITLAGLGQACFPI